MEEAEEQPLPQNELLSQLLSSEIKDESQTESSEAVKAEEAKAEEVKAEPENKEVSEPPSKKAKVQYGLAKWFKPEVKDHKPVVLEPQRSVGRPKTEMPVLTEALQRAYALA